MITKSHPFRLNLRLTSVLLLAGCSGISVDHAKGGRYSELPRSVLESQRENEMQRTWRGRPYDALLNAYGSPEMTMDVPGYRPLKTSVVVYGIHDQADDCIDAFTVVVDGHSNQPTVADYFCR